MNAARENINLANTDPELEQDHTACMTTEGSKNSNEAVKYITRSHGAKDTDQKKTADVKKASTSTEKAALKETSAPEKKTKRKLTYVSELSYDTYNFLSSLQLRYAVMSYKPILLHVLKYVLSCLYCN